MAKIDLYDPKWVDMVFAGKNKEYGAYQLRKGTSGRNIKALLILVIAAALVGGFLAWKVIEQKQAEEQQAYMEAMELAKLQQQAKKEEKKKEPVKPKVEMKKEIPTRTFLWVSGVKAQPITGIDGDHLGRGFRIVVDEFNRIPGMDGLFAIGDQCIQTTDPAYPGGHPQLAQVAIQQAALLAKNIQKIAEGATDSQLKPFRYKNLGSMATIGRNKAVVELGKFHSQGFFAWVLWLVVHLRSILGVKNKMMVMLNWLWKYVSYNDSIRMITYATKPKEVRDRLKREQTTHLGTDLLENEEEEEEV